MVGYGKRVLLVDEDEGAREQTALALSRVGFAVVEGCGGPDALAEMRRRRFDAVIAASKMPHLNGLTFLARARVLWPETPILMISDAQWDTAEISDIVVQQGAFAWIRKSSDQQVLLSMVILALEQSVEGQSARSLQEVGA